MPESYSSEVIIAGNQHMKYRAYVTAWVSSETDTAVTIGYSYSVDMYWAYLYGVAANVYVDGTWQNRTSGYLTSDPGANWAQVCVNSGYATVDKTDEPRNVTIQCNAWGETVSGYGSAGGETSCSVTIAISSGFTAHGAPTLLSNKDLVKKGEAVELTLTPSKTQGTAPFDHFEISDGINWFYVSPSTSTPAVVTTTDTPSEVLKRYGSEEYQASVSKDVLAFFREIRPNCVYYAAREVHKWNGTYPTSKWVWIEVEIDQTREVPFTVYDENGIGRVGIKVTVYDREGKAKSAAFTVYDSDRKARTPIVR